MTLQERQVANAKIKRKRNDELPAGAPMYYYCRGCGAEMKEPEGHSYPAPKLCHDCKMEGANK